MKYFTIFLIMATLLAYSTSFAGSYPQITSASAAFIDSGASIRVQWQAEEPVTRVLVSIGAERKIIDVDLRDNSRTPSGVSGEATAVVPVMQGGGIVAIQIEDEYRRKSEVVNIPITGQRQAQPFGFPQGAFQQGLPAHDDSWGKENLSRTRPQLPELKVGQGQPGMPVQSQDPAMAAQQQLPGMAPQMQGGMMPPAMPMQPPPMNIPPQVPNQVIAPTPPIPMSQNTPGMPPPPPPPQMPMDPGMIPPPPPPQMLMDPGMIPPPPPPPL